MKAVLSNRIYIETDAALNAHLLKELYYFIPPTHSAGQPTKIQSAIPVREGILSIPAGRQDLIPATHEIVDRRVCTKVKMPKIKSSIQLRPDQQRAVDSRQDNYIIVAPPAWGKTFTGTALISAIGCKTLIIVHTTFLLDQWVKEIKYMMGITPSIIGGRRKETSGPIIVGMIQTLRNMNISKELGDIGTILVDECLDYETLVTTRDGQRKIGAIVNNKEKHEVKSFNVSTRQWEWKPILRWFKNRAEEPMIKFRFNNNSSLKCTMNHSVITPDRGKIPAELLVEGDYIVAAKAFKSSGCITKDSIPLLLGMILGDGSLANNGKSVRLSITQGQAQKEYLDYKTGLLSGGFASDIREGKSGYKPTNCIYNSTSLSFYDTYNWRDKLYGSSSNKNTITKDIADLLTLDSWAIMYQDDGSISRERYITFSFCELDYVSMQYLQESLEELLSINSVQYTCKKGFRYLRLNAVATKIFIESIAHLIHKDLEYKKGRYAKDVEFIGSTPVVMFEDYTILQVTEVSFAKAIGGYRFNIEVEDNHNYLANSKLVGNCHHTPATSFKEVVDRSKARYKIGLTATPERKDRKHVVMFDHIGRDLYYAEDTNSLAPTIYLLDSNIRLPGNATVPWANRVNSLNNNDAYIKLLAGAAAIQASKGHQVLLLSDRLDTIDKLHDILGDSFIKITSNTSSDDREAGKQMILRKEKRGIIGSLKIFCEGISINTLSCLIIGSPINNNPLLTQMIGRVTRKLEDSDGKSLKLNPIVIDISLKGGTGKNQSAARHNFYIHQGWEVHKL